MVHNEGGLGKRERSLRSRLFSVPPGGRGTRPGLNQHPEAASLQFSKVTHVELARPSESLARKKIALFEGRRRIFSSHQYGAYRLGPTQLP